MVNIRKFKNRVRLISVVFLISIFMSSISVYAREDVDAISYIAENQTELLAICSKANNSVGSEILVYTGRDGLLSFSNEKYTKLTIDERRDFMETALLLVKESGMGDKVKNKAYNFIAEQDSTTSAAVRYLRSDASADFVEASTWFKPFSGVAGVILGVLSLFIFMLIGLSIVLDMAYMNIPGFRVILEKGESKRPRWVSREAYSSVIESESSLDSHYKGYMSLYFQRRVPSIILMTIALGYLISGQIYDIVVYLIDSFAWIFEQ